MKKSEQRAREKYPVYDFNGADLNASQRDTYRKGYEQAEADIKGELLQWLEYTRNLWAQTIADGAAIQTIQMVINKVQED